MSQGSSNPTTNLTKIRNVNISVGTGNSDTGTQRVVLASNQPALTINALPAGTNNIGDVDVVSLPGTVAADITAIKTATELLDNALGNDGATVAAGMLRVGGTDGTNNQTISVNTSGHVNIADGGNSITVDGTIAATQSGTWNINSITSLPTVTVAANSSVNLNQVAGTATATGNGVVGAGVQRVAIASDNTAFAVNANQSGAWNVGLNAGTNAIGKLSANDGVDIGDVTINNASIAVTGPLTDTQLRASAVPVSLASVPSHPVTNAGTFAVQVSSALPAGTNAIGSITNTSFAATQSGTWNINNISGTISLPTGAATETTLNAVKTGIELLDNTVIAASTSPTSSNQSLSVSLSPNSKAYDPADDMLKVKSMQKKFRDDFPGSSIDNAKWDTSIGTGGSITVSSGTLVIASGTTASSQTSVLSKEVFTIPFRLSFQLTLSQRIVNQSFIVEAISVNPSTGNPDGLNTIAWVFDGTSATQAKYRVQNGGVTALDSVASSIVTTAGTGVYELEPFADEAWFHSLTLDSTSGRSNSYRRHQQIPDPNAVYKIRLHWLNAGTAPASSTNATLQFIACQDYAELTAEITAGRGNSVAGQAMGVQVLNAQTNYTAPRVSGTSFQPSNSTSTAYEAGRVVKTSAGALFAITGYNSSTSSQFIHVYNTTSLPANGSVPVLVFRVPADSNFSFDLLPFGRYFSTGICIGNSSTGPTRTSGATDCWFDVQFL